MNRLAFSLSFGLIFILGYISYVLMSHGNHMEDLISENHHLDAEEIRILSSSPSPSEQYICYEYKFKDHFWGSSPTFYSIILNSEEEKDLEKGQIPMDLQFIAWNDQNEAILKSDETTEDESFPWPDNINGVAVIIQK
ncbi:hypothetical protein [Croceimicrobium hydrocarbonivorans]|uniref:Uncharacterized protein n=1 Tax=Croceimicrobium hydrocarbonivorans TaxID=2761580 RepID=A0A7H0VHL7_9FLAO|nr:hypothetical protein [Croceimicrobium hydrocarbonivorans]QNR25215.1 hypothetical protein H4K34_05070 [Croceimicrobium hydrocarbonivorans]